MKFIIVVGFSTGTSSKLASMGLRSLTQFYSSNNHIPPNIRAFPLEGEGKILDRVQLHHDQLKPDENFLSESDVVFIIAHSQGVPVSICLLQKLLEEKILFKENQCILLLSLCGIHHGPFPQIKDNLVVQYLEADAARELFELNNPDSPISIKYYDSIKKLLSYPRLKIVAVASFMDQVVPLYSALMHGIHHPSIYRAVYFEERFYRFQFLGKFISFLVSLRNKGIEDDELLVYISDFLGGSLLQDDTHSLLYEDLAVFSLALDWLQHAPSSSSNEEDNSWKIVQYAKSLLKITHPIKQADTILIEPVSAKFHRNHHFIPWKLHKLLINPNIQNDPILLMQSEEVKKLFSEWKPETKQLKELKYLLEPITAKL